MLLCFREFKLEAMRDSNNTYYISATDQHKTQLDDDDILCDSDSKSAPRNDVEIISSLSSLRSHYIYRVIMQFMLEVFLWALTAFTVHKTVILYMNGSPEKFQWLFYTSLFATLAILFFPGIVNPIVNDINGNWVNLRNGHSNLNGHCVLKRG